MQYISVPLTQRLFKLSVLFLLGVLLGCSDSPTGLPPAEQTGATVDVSPSIPPCLPIPTQQQLAWQRGELYMFVHFGISTFTGLEWGLGTENPDIFHPVQYNPQQWANLAREAGFKGVILTAKHVDGFCLWPSKLTQHSIAASRWREGKQDVVRDVAEACRRAGIHFGVYIALWDRNSPSYNSSAYNNFFAGQLDELLTGYGPIYEIWMDPGHEIGISEPPYDFNRYYNAMRQHQPGALIFGPDIRWIGNETGMAKETQWSPLDSTRWYPAECDVSIRTNWFWHEQDTVKSLPELLDIYFNSIGRNSVLLLNVPPNRDGIISEQDIVRLREFRSALNGMFSVDLTRGARAVASNVRREMGDSLGWAAQNVLDGKPATFWATDDSIHSSWLEIQLDGEKTLNVIELQEPIEYGQRIASYTVEAWRENKWGKISEGTTIGYKKLARIPTVTTSKLRVIIHSARACPALQKIGLFKELGK